MNSEVVENPFEVLVGEQLSSVVFVQDYLQLDFDGSRLTCFIWPEVTIGDSVFRFGDESYRNQLCSIISKEVAKTILIQDVIIQIVFDTSSEIRLSLDPKNPQILHEIAMFVDEKGNWSFF